MIKKIVYTVFSKAGVALLNFGAMMLSARLLGPALRGDASLLIATVSILSYISGIIGGPAIANHCKEIDLKKFVKQFYILTTAFLFVLNLALYIFGFSSLSDAFHQLLLSVILSFYICHQSILTGHNHIKAYNIAQLLQALLPLLVLVFGYFILPVGGFEYSYFILATYASFAIPFVFVYTQTHPLIYTKNDINSMPRKHWQLADIMRSGMVSQLSNILQLFNYRLMFYLLGWLYTDHTLLGEYTLAVALSETVWILGRSISLVQLGDLLQQRNADTQHATNTIKLAQTTGILTCLALLIICAIPQTYIQWLVGDKYLRTHQLLLFLAPATFIFSLQFPISSFFASRNIYKHANTASLLSLISLLLVSYYLVNHWGLMGAAASTFLAYFTSTAYFYWAFKQYRAS